MKKSFVFVLIMFSVLLSAFCRGSSESVSDFRVSDNENITLGEREMKNYNFNAFGNVGITGVDLRDLDDAQLELLYIYAQYCQAMTDQDIETMRKLVSSDKIFVHMSGMRQSREEYFADVSDGSLRYYRVDIENPVISINGTKGTVTCTSALDADAYGAIGVFRMKGTHHFELLDGSWKIVNK